MLYYDHNGKFRGGENGIDSSLSPDGAVVSPTTSLLYSPTATLFSPTSLTAPKIMSVSEEDHLSLVLAKYPAAITDFYGSGTLCVYKTGPAWPVAQGPQSQKIRRAARPIYNHGIAPTWLKTAWDIVALLESLQVDWNTVDPLAYANKGQAELICDFVISIGVNPRSLAYEAAVAAANAVDVILEVSKNPRYE